MSDWHVDYQPGAVYAVVRDTDDDPIAEVYVSRGEEAADLALAHLIAASPALRDALSWAVEWMESYEGETMPEWREWAARARAALASASPPAGTGGEE